MPKSTLGNWCREFKQWCPQLRVLKFYGSKDERALIRERDLVYGEFDVAVCSYEVAIKEKAALTKFTWEYIIIDEASPHPSLKTPLFIHLVTPRF